MNTNRAETGAIPSTGTAPPVLMMAGQKGQSMNTYKITAYRENGTTIAEHITARTEAQAKRDFAEIYRHSGYEFGAIELVRTDASATKQQEREALEKIRKMVAELGPESYIATAFEGCFEIAEQNIEHDFADSLKSRLERAEKKIRDGEAERTQYKHDLEESIKDYEAAHAAAHEIAEEKDTEIAALKAEIEELRKQSFTEEELADIEALTKEKIEEYETGAKEAAVEIVNHAENPESAEFKKAVSSHKIAKTATEYCKKLHRKIETVMKAGA